MKRTMIWTLVLSWALASATGATPTPEERCQGAKLNALRKRAFCIAGERRKEVLGRTPDTAKCEEKFGKALAVADTVAAKKSASCRWRDNGDGTATDLNTGLQWELKTDDGSVHDKDNTYTWCIEADSQAFYCEKPGHPADGTAFTEFLASLNRGASTDGSSTTGCFAGHCDWRLPTIGELRSMFDAQFPNCAMSPCTTIPGFIGPSFYWSSSTVSFHQGNAWGVRFFDGHLGVYEGNFPERIKTIGSHVRAVRAGPGAAASGSPGAGLG